MIFPKQGEFVFPIVDGRIKTLGGDQELRTSTLIRPQPIQGEGHVVFLGESEGSLPEPHDSLPDAGEAINGFWSMSGSFIYRHHVEPRVKLYSPREESFPIPLKYIDVTRTTHANLDVKQERRIDDFGTSMGQDTRILGQVSHNLLCWKKKLLKDGHFSRLSTSIWLPWYRTHGQIILCPIPGQQGQSSKHSQSLCQTRCDTDAVGRE